MSVSLMHQWHDSCVGEWFLTPSLWLWSACEWVRGEWMHPRSDICYLLLSVIWWMWLCVQYTSFTTHWGHPSVYIWYSEASPLDFIWGDYWYYLICSGHVVEILNNLNLDFNLVPLHLPLYLTFTFIITLLNLYLYIVTILHLLTLNPMRHILSLISISYYFVVISVHWAF